MPADVNPSFATMRAKIVGIGQRYDFRQSTDPKTELESGPGGFGGEAAPPGVPLDAIGQFDIGRFRHRTQHDITEIVVGSLPREHTPVAQSHAEVGADALARPLLQFDRVGHPAIADEAHDLGVGVHANDRGHIVQVALAEQEAFGCERR
jgi:hypothetical protein